MKQGLNIRRYQTLSDFLFMHSDIENYVKATSKVWVNLKDQPGVWRTITQKWHTSWYRNFKAHFLWCVKSVRNGEDKRHFWHTSCDTRWPHFFLKIIHLKKKKKNTNPTTEYFQNNLTWPYPMFNRWDLRFQSFQQNAELKKHIKLRGRKKITFPIPHPVHS